MGRRHLRAHATSAGRRARWRALPKTQGDDRARVRQHEVQPPDRPLRAPRKIGRPLRVATNHRHPQPPEAPQAPNSRRRRLKGAPEPLAAPTTANATINPHIAAHASRPFERQPRRRAGAELVVGRAGGRSGGRGGAGQRSSAPSPTLLDSAFDPRAEQLSNVVDLVVKDDQAATLSSVVSLSWFSSSVTLMPSLNFTPSSTSATRSWPLNRRQRSWALSSSL